MPTGWVVGIRGIGPSRPHRRALYHQFREVLVTEAAPMWVGRRGKLKWFARQFVRRYQGNERFLTTALGSSAKLAGLALLMLNLFASPVSADPKFLRIHAFGLVDVGDRSSTSFVGIDGDGDLDAFVGASVGDFTFLLNDGTVNSSTATITVNVTSANDIPTLSAISDPSAILTAQTVSLSGIGTGASNEPQTLTVTATSSNTSLIPNPTVTYTSADATGSLAYTPVTNANGTATVTVTVTDDGGTSNSGSDTVSQTFTVSVTAVNDPPTLSDFTPTDGATDVAIPVTLTWQAKDPDNPDLKFSVRIGEAANILNTHARDLTEPRFSTLLTHNTTFFYQILVSDGTHIVEGPVLRFTTQADTQAPELSRVTAGHVTDTRARITWITNEPGTSVVIYSQNPDLSGAFTAATKLAATGLNTSHTVSLDNLTAETRYFAQAKTTDGAGNEGTSPVFTFTTLREPDTRPPDIIHLFAEGIGHAAASIRLSTDELTTVIISLTDGGAPMTGTSSTPAQDHLIPFTGLSPGTPYTATVTATDHALPGNVTIAEIRFSTKTVPDTHPPAFLKRPEFNPTHNSLTVSFETHEPVTCTLVYGTSINTLSNSITVGHGLSLATEITGLMSGTAYFFQLTCTDASGNTLQTDVLSAKTLTGPDITGPLALEGPTAHGIGQEEATIVITTDEPAFVRIHYDAGDLVLSSPRTPLSATAETRISVRLTGLKSDTQYRYQAILHDAAGNETIVETDPFTTLALPDTSPPQFTDPAVVSQVGFDHLTVEWGTHEATTSEVEAIPVASAKTQVPAEIFRRVRSKRVTDHSLTLSGLLPGTLYRLKLRSRDHADNLLEFVLGEVRTALAPDTTPPEVTELPVVRHVTHTRATIEWEVNELADGFVEYGTDAALSNALRVGSTHPKTEQKITLTNLTPGTQYFARILSTDLQGNGPTTRPEEGRTLAFRTEADSDMTSAQFTEGPTFLSPTETSVRVRIRANEPVTARLRYSTDQNALTKAVGGGNEVFSPSLKEEHILSIEHLPPNTRQYVRVEIVDAAKNKATISPIRSVKTKKGKDTKPPTYTSQPSAVEIKTGSVTIVWHTDELSNSVAILHGGPTKSRKKAVLHHRVPITGLNPNTEYTFEIASTDKAGNTARKSGGSFRTRALPDLHPPRLLEGPSLIYGSHRQVILSLRVDEEASVRVFVIGPNSPVPFAPYHGQGRRTSHNINITRLFPDVFYTYYAVIEDAKGNRTIFGNPIGLVSKPGVVTKIIQPPGGGGSFVTSTQSDTQVPVITRGPRVVATSDNALTIEWSTDEASDSGISFGVNDLDLRIEDGSDILSHRITLTNLEPGTSYQYQVDSTDPEGNGATTSRVALAKTALRADAAPPVITSDPQVIYLTERAATLFWQTDEGAGTFIEYGTDSLNTQKTAPDLVTTHQVSLTNLSPETSYRYRVAPTDAGGNGPTKSQILTFTTEAQPDIEPPKLIGTPEVALITESSATIRWTTNELSDAAVKYAEGEGRAPNDLGLVAGSARDVLVHEVHLTNLQPNTTYTFLVESVDRSDNGPIVSQTLSFTTAEGKDQTPPAIPQNLAARGPVGELVLTWTPVADPDLAGYDVLRGTGENNLTPIATGLSEPRFRDEGLDASLPYRYAVRAVDRSTNESALSTSATAIPDGSGLPTEPPPLMREGDPLQPLLIVQNAKSPARLTYAFQVALDEAFEQIVTQISEIIQGASTNREGATAWQIDTPLEKDVTYYWRARAFDGVFTGPFIVPESFIAGQLPFNPGDFDGDGEVGFPDFIVFASGFGTTQGEEAYRPELDFDENGEIGFPDFIRFADLFGTVYE
ncbi:MAG: fibronectin type III domain-containing protein [bacterium]|nr:fibronectin type III domain-containing protein [bacterium]